MDTLPPPESKIYSVSVLSNTSVEITWENNPADRPGGYILYRLNHHNGYYEVIHRNEYPEYRVLAEPDVHRYWPELSHDDVCIKTASLRHLRQRHPTGSVDRSYHHQCFVAAMGE